jgi:hypothetical protein
VVERFDLWGHIHAGRPKPQPSQGPDPRRL